MKPIIKKENEKTILTSDITSNHIIVGIDKEGGNPIVLTCNEFEGNKFKFTCINEEFTINNGYNTFASIEDAVNDRIEHNSNLQVFHEKDWKKALQWLIDNAE